MTFALQRYATLAIFLVCAISFLPQSSGLTCTSCGIDECHLNITTTCTPPSGGFCYSSRRSDLSGHHWIMVKGCADPNSPICKATGTDGGEAKCCNGKDSCNDNLFELPIKCNCYKDNCDNNDPEHCTLKSDKFSCYTELNRRAGHIVSKKGCMRKCKDNQTDDEIRICCRSNKCNNHDTTVWPSSKSPTEVPSASTTTTEYLTATTTATIATSTITVGPTVEHRISKLICNCSECDTPFKTCEATVGCLLGTTKSQSGVRYIASCVNIKSSCTNGTLRYSTSSTVMCCNSYNYCNAPPKSSPGPPCDDEDADQSGCYSIDPVTPSTVSPSTTASTSTNTTSTSSTTNDFTTGSTQGTPISSNKATPTKGITAEEFEEEDDDSHVVVFFYFFTILLTIFIVAIIIIIIVCLGLVCHYKGMAYKTALSSSTILESALKEKMYRINNGSPNLNL